ncbi:MAG: YitT family protein [Erysipelotrichales bacterium]|nr:YitT family protein [Erysipelotrichales bacterium]
MKFRKGDLLKMLQDIVTIIVGNFILAYSVQAFILPNDILSGGVAGIAVALYPIFHLDQELVINILVIGCFLLGWLVLGKEFAVKTCISSAIYPVFIGILSGIAPLTTDHTLASLYGGVLAGLGIGMVFRANASTGGMDVPPLILAKYTHIEVSKWVLVVDALTILLGLYSYNVESVLVGLLSVVTSSYTINAILMLGAQEAKSIQIITSKVEEVRCFIDKQLDRGCTLFNVYGGYKNEERTMILVVIDKSQYPLLNEGIHEIDPDAFMIITDTREVKGNGFSFHSGV